MRYNDLIKNGTLSVQQHDMMSKNNFANVFDVVNLGENSYFNMCKTLYFDNIQDSDPSYYSTYMASSTDTWPLISYKFYGTIQLWWLICKFNDVKNPLKQIEQGTVVAIPTKQMVDVILSVMEY